MDIASEILGWIGTTLILLACGLISFKKIGATSWCYHVMNLAGAVALEVVRAAIALLALARSVRTK